VAALRHATSLYNYAYEDPNYCDNPEGDLDFVDAELS